MTAQSYQHARWYTQMPEELQELTKQSSQLLDREKRLKSNLHDYSFVLFPIAKAYEGFLKQYLYDYQLISQEVFEGRKFRIGRALNPDLPDRQRDKWWLYDDVSVMCGDQVAREMWEVWIKCRNHVFHFFAHQKNHLTIEDVEKRMQSVLQVMERLSYCTIPDHTQQLSHTVRNERSYVNSLS